MLKLKDYIFSSLFKDFGQWPLWIPVLFGIGIALYFNISFEPSLWWSYGGLVFFIYSLFTFRLQILSIAFLAISFIALGFSIASLRTHSLKTEMLNYSLPILSLEGTIHQVELRPTLKGVLYQRLLLSDLTAKIAEKLPQKIYLTLKGKRARLWPGQRIRILAKLNPIRDPFIPGAFDFRRQAYFQGIGATGFALSIPEILSTSSSVFITMEKKREEITALFVHNMPSPLGAIAAALITGDKASIPTEIRENFINSGLAHILAISGLHLSIIASVVFFLIRRGLALIPYFSLHYNSKKFAALGTFIMSFFYLILSGFGLPAQRAFIMISLMMGAILIDRKALSMRTVAFAGFIVLLFLPQSLLGPSFQLSFAAVISLIAGYEHWKNPISRWKMKGGIGRTLLVYIGGLAFTSLLATLATLPFTIYIFHRFSLHAIEANLLAVPLTSLLIMPSALLVCVLTPFGLGAGPLWVFEKSLNLLVHIAANIASWPGSNVAISQPPLLALIFVVFGSLWLCLWQQPWRRAGIFLIIIGIVSFFWHKSPDILIDGQGKIVGIYRENMLYVTSLRKGKFTAESWQHYLAAKEIKGIPSQDGIWDTTHHTTRIIICPGKDIQPCEKGSVLICLEPNKTPCPSSLLTIDWYDLWRGGAHALWLNPKRIFMETVIASQGDRPWTRRPIPKKNRPITVF